MSQEKLVSIIMPAYNADRSIRNSIDSVLSQTYPTWELLIVNDCSKDNSAKIAQEYCDKDTRIKLFHNGVNSGPAITRNDAINRAKGRFIAFLDSDDIWLPGKLEKQIGTMLECAYSFTYTSYHRISEDGTVPGRRIGVPDQLDYAKLLRNTAIVTSSVVIDINAIGGVQMKNTYYDDFACWLEIMKRGFVAYGIDDDLVAYRISTASISRNKINSAIQVWNTYRTIEGLGILNSAYYFTGYALKAIQKYYKF
ncbi:glycosyltransferase family 2 protein [Candidatus Vondammii sp. HM_W22]|uniref:glycosyltransferase family 2 protein n=1 Tax=Candidatus Vondammii sp. HM_W22 TaxID=2687299 RepID=UPI001F128EC8|nr:glycosyltransferase family 2 protein [Candidatus Vondammii sp. HM_W22]